MAYSLISEVTNKSFLAPNLAGEFCGNWHPELGHQPSGSLTTPFDPSRWRKGRPRPIDKRTTAELMAEGWVGLYLLHDLSSRHAVHIPTPDELLEPTE